MDLNKIKQYYYDGWGAIHDYGDIAVVISDAFRDPTDWNGFMSSGFKNVILDTHLYQVFSAGQLAMDIGAHVSSACGIGKQLGGVDKWTVIGEWSGALTDVSPPPRPPSSPPLIESSAQSGSTASAAAPDTTTPSRARGTLVVAPSGLRGP